MDRIYLVDVTRKNAQVVFRAFRDGPAVCVDVETLELGDAEKLGACRKEVDDLGILRKPGPWILVAESARASGTIQESRYS